MKGFGEGAKLVGGDEALLVGDLFYAADLVAGTLLNDFHELASLVHAFERPCVEPGAATAHGLDFELAAL